MKLEGLNLFLSPNTHTHTHTHTRTHTYVHVSLGSTDIKLRLIFSKICQIRDNLSIRAKSNYELSL